MPFYAVLLHAIFKRAKWISLSLAFFPVFLVLPLTYYYVNAHGCTVADFQITTCITQDDTLVQSLNNGLVFSLWGLLLTVPIGIAFYFASIWSSNMLQLYHPMKRTRKPPLFPGENTSR